MCLSFFYFTIEDRDIHALTSTRNWTHFRVFVGLNKAYDTEETILQDDFADSKAKVFKFQLIWQTITLDWANIAYVTSTVLQPSYKQT